MLQDALEAVAEEELDRPDLLRLRGDLLVREGADASRVEATYREAIDLARRYGARAYELRAATSLGRFLVSRGRAAEAREILVPLFAVFREGFETRDLREARALLGQLAQA